MTIVPLFTHSLPRTSLYPSLQSVADLNGLALSCFLEICVLRKKRPWMMNEIEKKLSMIRDSSDVTKSICKDYDDHLSKILWTEQTKPEKYSRLATIYKVLIQEGTAGLVSAYTQLSSFSWLTQESINLVLSRLGDEIPGLPNASVEVNHEFKMPLPPKIREGVGIVLLQGFCDVETGSGSNIYEIRCTSELTDVHKLSLVCYAFLHTVESSKAELKMRGGGPKEDVGDYDDDADDDIDDEIVTEKNFSLLNVLTNERWELLTKTLGPLREAVQIILDAKLGSKKLANDDIFIQQAAKLRSGIGIVADDFLHDMTDLPVEKSDEEEIMVNVEVKEEEVEVEEVEEEEEKEKMMKKKKDEVSLHKRQADIDDGGGGAGDGGGGGGVEGKKCRRRSK
jgi:hypothetical protein